MTFVINSKFADLRMTLIGNESIVDWTIGPIRSLIQHGVWMGCSDRKKRNWIREMDDDQNLSAKVRVVIDIQMVELFLSRNTVAAGKWVKLDWANFHAVLAEAMKVEQRT